MAPVNPTINPTDDPNFRGHSSPISVPDTIKPQGVQQNQILPRGQEIGDRSAEYLGKAAGFAMQAEGSKMEAYGDLFKNITQMGDFIGKSSVAITKKEIEDKVYQVANQEREDYIATLQKIKDSGVNKIMAPTESEATKVPDEVAGLEDTLVALKGARDGGKIPKSYYEGRLLELAKNIRKDYPGFKQFIDETFAKVTGRNPANAVIGSLVSEINRNASQASSELKKTEAFILQRNGYPNASDALRNVQTGKWDMAKAMEWAAPYEREDYELTRKSKVLSNTKMDLEQRKEHVGGLIDYAAAVAVNRSVDTMVGRMGINTGDNAAMLNLDVRAQNIPQQQWTTWGQEIAQHKAQLALQLSKDADKSGATQALGKKEVNARIEEALKPLDRLADRIYAKDIGGFVRLEQDLKAMNEEGQKRLLTHPKLGPYLQTAQALKEIGGEQNLKEFSLNIIKGEFNNDLKTYFTAWTREFATQTNVKRNNVATTFNDVIDDLKSKGIKDTKLNAAILGEVSKITDGKVPEAVRLNYAIAAFSPGNYGMISKLSDDAVDNRGRKVTGQSAIFQKWTSEEMTRTMFELGKKEPQAWKNYTDWVQHTLVNEVVPKEIKALGEIRNPHIRVGWDTENKRFVPRYDSIRSSGEAESMRAGAPQRSNRPEEDPEYQNVVRVTNRLNSAIGNYKNVASAANVDPDALVIKAIASSNNGQVLQNVEGIPYQILKDIGLARMKSGGSK